MQPLVVLSLTPVAAWDTRPPACTAAVGLRQSVPLGCMVAVEMRQATGPRYTTAVGCRRPEHVPLPRPPAARRVSAGLLRNKPPEYTPTHQHRAQIWSSRHHRAYHCSAQPPHTTPARGTAAVPCSSHSHRAHHSAALRQRPPHWPTACSPSLGLHPSPELPGEAARGARPRASQVVRASERREEIASGGRAASDSGGGGSGEDGESGATTQRLVWGLYGAYMLWLLVLPFAPGEPAWDIQPETVTEVADLSLNFFFILPLLNQVGIHTMEAPSLHPAAEALFNFVNAWSVMFGPLLQLDSSQRPQSSPPSRAAAIWSGQVFLTNVFLIPYMALRLSAPKDSTDTNSTGTGSPVPSSTGAFTAWLGESLVRASKPLGAVGGAVAALSLYWFCFGRQGEGYGDGVPERWAFFVDYISTNRLAYAFVVDIVLYSCFQAWLVSAILQRKGSAEAEPAPVPGAVKAFGYVPCFGLAALLIAF